ncbi:uncharacterized protein FOMMEDRAFT_21915 [Fomitiporia mediterranea MF3/22]|uniref:uncharacterized protein n=1 Tax=Fomitiporia mediterranea (strain MF3/22) TaxID=694068 RepID=UPI00044083AD|nr:uncharacterized protein FOMMEDRAFT_21915 [Fomitiporia mediterranea MF3/22]EJD01541.1 hypothetical protein FOMMEDRAFT_21915 [Fomitiporia mediterranea MF3/22]
MALQYMRLYLANKSILEYQSQLTCPTRTKVQTSMIASQHPPRASLVHTRPNMISHVY